MTDQPKTRIQKKNRETILDAALDVFSAEGFRGATLDQIASNAGLSKPNLLYYFASKEVIYTELLSQLLDTWLDPLRALDAQGDPVDEILAYVRRKFEMTREYPRESRLFANEIVQGAPRILDQIEPHHLIFSIWATTQHYADFDVQVRGLLAPQGDEHLDGAETYLVTLFRSVLTRPT